jgi:2',3'-cyclic-nucleotide 2'-phosphodiesterase (5'-nucleotidase family)
MNWYFKHFVIFITLCVFIACKEQNDVSKIVGVNLPVTDSIETNNEIESYIQPYRKHVNNTLDSVLCYNPTALTKNDTPLNTALGNWMADKVYEATNPIFYKRTGATIDFVLLNHGGIRAGLYKGNITARNAFEVMPFENSISVVEINGDKMKDLINYLVKAQKAHPISKELKLTVSKKGLLTEALLKGVPLDYDRSYKVATSDYLANLGDQMIFFADPINRTDINYLIRNIFIDTFKQIDTIKASYDNRFTFE